MNIGESFLQTANNGHFRSMPADLRQYLSRDNRLRPEDVDMYIVKSSNPHYLKKQWCREVNHHYKHDDGSLYSRDTLLYYLKMELQDRGIMDFHIGSGTPHGSTKRRSS